MPEDFFTEFNGAILKKKKYQRGKRKQIKNNEFIQLFIRKRGRRLLIPIGAQQFGQGSLFVVSAII